MKRAISLLLVGLVVLLALHWAHVAAGSEVSAVETEGTVQFTGRYEPIGVPDPPPEGGDKPVRPPGILPQTNTIVSHTGSWLGSLIIGLVIWMTKIKTNTIKQNKKAGNYS